jgi:acetyltransferase-like isoleucine patch superfamily enzyme
MIALLLAILPSFLHVPIRRMMGANIARGARIRFGTWLSADQINLGEGSTIGPFAGIRANSFTLGRNSAVKPLSLVSAGRIVLGDHVHISPLTIIKAEVNQRSSMEMGDHSRTFPFVWIEPGEGVKIGQHVGIGGHTLIFTHGAWSDYLQGGPMSYGPVVIEDHVWLPWRVFIMPGVTIGERAVIAAGSVVGKSIPPWALAAGMPAQVVRENSHRQLSEQDQIARAQEIVTQFREMHPHAEARIVLGVSGQASAGDIVFLVTPVSQAEMNAALDKGCAIVDYAQGHAYVRGGSKAGLRRFLGHLRRYGIRISIEDFPGG